MKSNDKGLNKASSCSTDCRTEEGVEVGLIDGIIAMARCIRRNHVESFAIKEALIDLRSDEDVQWLMSNAEISVPFTLSKKEIGSCSELDVENFVD